MPVERCTPAQIIGTERTYHRWGAEYGGMRPDQVNRQRELGRENSRLGEIVADRALYTAILNDAALGNL